MFSAAVAYAKPMGVSDRRHVRAIRALGNADDYRASSVGELHGAKIRLDSRRDTVYQPLLLPLQICTACESRVHGGYASIFNCHSSI
jgi:hypothetical protein